jgi:predicted nucleotidyltransferase component of viral defense system
MAESMIDEYQLMGFLNRFRDARQLERDYLLVLLLHEIYSVFTRELVFKGGTALKYFYNLNRFSEDADFSFAPSKGIHDRRALMATLGTALDNFDRQYQITERESRAGKASDAIMGINYEIRVKGPLNQRSGQLQNINIDVSLRPDLLTAPELKYLTPLYPDIGTFSLPVMDINEILAEKTAAIIERTRMRDIYDVYYLLAIKGVNYNEKLLKEKMHKRKERFEPEVLLEKLKAAEDKMRWRSELAYIVSPLPDSHIVVSQLKRLMGL